MQPVRYLLFNEGYGATQGDSLVRQELCEEALRLGHMLLGHPQCDRPSTRALASAPTEAERSLLRRQLEDCTAGAATPGDESPR